MTQLQQIPLFPLSVVMFPRGKQELQIFERRYIDLVSQCLRSDSGFGICLLKAGEETLSRQSAQTIHRTGTYARIVDWDQLDNGLLGITVEGLVKFKIDDCWPSDSGVLQAKVAFSAAEKVGAERIELDEDFAALVDLLRNLESHPLVENQKLQIDYNNLWDLGWRLAEMIPIEQEQKQALLDLDDPWERIERIEKLVADLATRD